MDCRKSIPFARSTSVKGRQIAGRSRHSIFCSITVSVPAWSTRKAETSTRRVLSRIPICRPMFRSWIWGAMDMQRFVSRTMNCKRSLFAYLGLWNAVRAPMEAPSSIARDIELSFGIRKKNQSWSCKLWKETPDSRCESSKPPDHSCIIIRPARYRRFCDKILGQDPVSTNGRGLVGGYDDSHCIQGFQGMGVHWA